MQETYAPRHAIEVDVDASMASEEQVQQMAKEFVASVSEAQKLLHNLHTNIIVLVE